MRFASSPDATTGRTAAGPDVLFAPPCARKSEKTALNVRSTAASDAPRAKKSSVQNFTPPFPRE